MNKIEKKVKLEKPEAVEGAVAERAELKNELDNPEYVREGIPTAQLQLEVIVGLGLMAYEKAPRARRKEAWTAYKKCIDDFRRGYGLPPIDEAWTKYKVPIGEAMERGDGKDLLKIFDTERAEYPKARKFWEKLSRTGGPNFIMGIAAGVGEDLEKPVNMVKGVMLIGKEAKMATGVDATPEEQKAARYVLASTFQSLQDIASLAEETFRIDEYKEAFAPGQHGEKFGYVAGKSYYDLAKIILLRKVAGGVNNPLTGSKAAAWIGATVLEKSARSIVKLREELDKKKNG